MSKIDNGGPAFPKTDDGCIGHQHPGMTLRDWFAAMAMQGSLQMLSHKGSAACMEEMAERFTGMSAMTYMIADAMLAERAKGAA